MKYILNLEKSLTFTACGTIISGGTFTFESIEQSRAISIVEARVGKTIVFGCKENQVANVLEQGPARPMMRPLATFSFFIF